MSPAVRLPRRFAALVLALLAGAAAPGQEPAPVQERLLEPLPEVGPEPLPEVVREEFALRELALAPAEAGAAAAVPSSVAERLERGLASEAWTERELALRALFRRRLLGRLDAPADGAVGPRTGVDPLEFVADPAPNVREAALELLLLESAEGLDPDPDATLARLEPLLADPWPRAAELAVRAIAAGSARGADALLGRLAASSPAPELRSAAALALAERYAAGRSGPAELELALIFDEPDRERADERYAELLRRLAPAPAERLERLTQFAWSAEPRVEAALHGLSLAAGGAGELERLVQYHFDAPLPPELRLQVARAAARRAGLAGAERYVAAAVRAARVERALRAGAVLTAPTAFDAGLAAELERQPEAWAGLPARRLFEIALDAAPPEQVAELALDAVDEPETLELLLSCLVDEPLLFNAELVRRLGERARSRESLELLVDLYDAGAARGDGLARLALLELVEHGDPGVEGLAFRSLARRLETLSEAELLHARAFADETRAEQARRMVWLGGGVSLEPFASDLIAIGMGDLEQRDRAARLLARVQGGAQHARVLLTLERWLVEAQLAMSDAEPELSRAAEREAATRVGQLGAAGGEAVVEPLLRSLAAARGRSVELGLAAVRALGETAAGRARLGAALFGPEALADELRREAWMERLGGAAAEAEWAGEREALAALGEELLDGADAKQRSKLIAGLGRLGADSARAALIRLAGGELELAAQSAIAALAGFESAAPALARRAREGPSYERRLAAVRALRSSAAEEAPEALAALAAELAEGADWGLAHPAEGPLLADELRVALAELGRLPAGALGRALGEVLETAAEDQLAALEGRRGERASLRWRAPLAVLEAGVRDGEFGQWLRGADAPAALARLAPDFLAEAVGAAVRGGDPAAVLALAEARVAALAGLERPLEQVAALEFLADATRSAGGAESLAAGLRARAAALAREHLAAR